VSISVCAFAKKKYILLERPLTYLLLTYLLIWPRAQFNFPFAKIFNLPLAASFICASNTFVIAFHSRCPVTFWTLPGRSTCCNIQLLIKYSRVTLIVCPYARSDSFPAAAAGSLTRPKGKRGRGKPADSSFGGKYFD